MARDGRESDRDDFGFVDRDDEREDSLVDADYDDGFPGEPGEAMDDAPDPGYAAYAEEVEDPLADWPYPDRSRDDRAGRAARERTPDARGPDAPPPRETGFPEQREDRLETRDSNLKRADERDRGPAPEDAGDPPDDFPDLADAPRSAAIAPRSDSDDEAPEDDWFKADTDDGALTSDYADILDDDDAPAPEPPRRQPPAAPAEDDFVDDFLNDLDDHDDAYEADATVAGDGAGWPEDDLHPRGRIEAESAAAQAGAAALAREAARHEERVFDSATPPEAVQDAEGPDGSRLFPWAMIAVVVVALVLLGVGGYGVVKQRGELEAQIRDLQAQLATAVTADEMSAERERQQQIELENESLAAEIDALQAENAALAQDIASLEARLEEQQAAAAQEVQEAQRQAAEAAAERATAQREAAAGSARDAAAAGPWFVNFGSYAERDIADRWAGRLNVDDGEVVVQSAQAAGRTLYRVRVVGLTSQDRAERVATTLERQYQLPRLWVGRN